MVRAYLISLLARQQLAKGKKARDGFPHAWLVWEPGSWTPASRRGEETIDGTRTPILQPESPGRPPAGDALCFELASKAPKPWSLRLGRSPENDICVNDMTVSRFHLVLASADGEKWGMRLSEPGKLATYKDKPLSPTEDTLCADGVVLVVGGVSLTYLSSVAFWQRVEDSASRIVR